jgi:hypothetical protein
MVSGLLYDKFSMMSISGTNNLAKIERTYSKKAKNGG